MGPGGEIVEAMERESLAKFARLAEAEREIVQLREALDEASKRDHWIAIGDGLPKPRTDVLVWDGQGVFEDSLVPDSGSFVWLGAINHVTHWMPLPAPPQGDDNDS